MLRRKTSNLILLHFWFPDSRDLNLVNYQTWATMHESVHQADIHIIDDLKQRLIQFWYNLDQNIMDTATDQWCKRLLSRSSCERR